MTNNTIEIQETNPNSLFPTISPVTDAELVDYLRHSYKLAEIATLAEEEAFIVKLCQHFDIQVSDEEWQAAGDAFRLEHKLLGVKETTDWLARQRITVEDWSEGIRLRLLTKKLKEYLFGANVDMHYISNREHYKRVALSQILVLDLATASEVMRSLSEEKTSFCALALEYSKGKQSHTNGGFLGILYASQLAPEMASAITDAPVGAVIGPIQTELGYHIIRVEKWFPTEMSESVREEILNTLWRVWLREQKDQNEILAEKN
ncbi:MAG: peptidylprolyl isomerase [Xenococcaceae cyanobacterium MO_167.B27]|nr:peptidylprolyl isomerase [Xenococcaceae cyanobacterium MO_167.B27]